MAAVSGSENHPFAICHLPFAIAIFRLGVDAAVSLGATAGVPASTLTYANPPTIFAEGNRILLAASLGNATADGSGTVRVFIDDKPTTTGANNRTWYDGLGWALVTANYPTNLTYRINGNTLSMTWPPTHLGWILQAQTNDAMTGLSNNWYDLPATGSQTQAVVNISSGTAFFRLRRP